jgi:hypothetical protein
MNRNSKLESSFIDKDELKLIHRQLKLPFKLKELYIYEQIQ